MSKRFKVVYIEDDDEWTLYDSNEDRYYDIDLSEYQKETERIKRNHENLHEKYEELEKKYTKYASENTKLKGNESSARIVYENLKNVFEEK